MHTSSLLSAGDFACARPLAGDTVAADFAAMFHDHHELDRVAIVSPRLEDGILFAGIGLLALTTAFYDVQRARGGAFHDYPQHFALIGGDGARVATRTGTAPATEALLRASWGNLDVWPQTNWFVVAPTATAMLERVFALQINRLFWPESLTPDGAGPRLPALARALLRSRLKSVLLYDGAAPDAEIRGSAPAMAVVARSIAALPGDSARTAHDGVDRFHLVGGAEFLASVAACFDDGIRRATGSQRGPTPLWTTSDPSLQEGEP